MVEIDQIWNTKNNYLYHYQIIILMIFTFLFYTKKTSEEKSIYI